MRHVEVPQSPAGGSSLGSRFPGFLGLRERTTDLQNKQTGAHGALRKPRRRVGASQWRPSRPHQTFSHRRPARGCVADPLGRRRAGGGGSGRGGGRSSRSHRDGGVTGSPLFGGRRGWLFGRPHSDGNDPGTNVRVTSRGALRKRGAWNDEKCAGTGMKSNKNNRPN